MFRDNRFVEAKPTFQRNPSVGDVGTVVEVYSDPIGYEVECCAAGDGITSWLEPMYPGEIESLHESDPNNA